MSNWSYVAIAYTVVWGGLALYALTLARRVHQAGRLDRQLRAMDGASEPAKEGPCDDGPRSG